MWEALAVPRCGAERMREPPSCYANTLPRGDSLYVWCPFKPWVTTGVFRAPACSGCPYSSEPERATPTTATATEAQPA